MRVEHAGQTADLYQGVMTQERPFRRTMAVWFAISGDGLSVHNFRAGPVDDLDVVIGSVRKWIAAGTPSDFRDLPGTTDDLAQLPVPDA